MDLSVHSSVCSSDMCDASGAAASIFNETEMTHLNSNIPTASCSDWHVGGGGITSQD